jgi:UDP-glucose 4-epimerase
MGKGDPADKDREGNGMRRIAVTGVSGYLGDRLLQRLTRQEEVESIIGIDLSPPRSDSPKLRFYPRDVCDPFGDVLSDNKVDAAVHLAFAVRPSHDREGARRINIEGARNFMEACQQASVGTLLYLSSHTTYGPHPDNPVPLTEASPLRPIRSFPYSWDKGEADRMFQDWMAQCPDVCVNIVRACSILGPQGIGSVSAGMFQTVMIRLIGYDPLVQFLHEEDLVALITTLLRKRKGGVFNAGGEGALRYREIVAETGRPCVAVPAKMLSAVLTLSWRLRLQNESPPGGLEFIKYPIVVSTEKAKEALGFTFRYSTRDTLRSYLGAAHRREKGKGERVKG